MLGKNYVGEISKSGIPNGFGICYNPLYNFIADGYFNNGIITGFTNVITKRGLEFTTGRVLCVNGTEIFTTGKRSGVLVYEVKYNSEKNLSVIKNIHKDYSLLNDSAHKVGIFQFKNGNLWIGAFKHKDGDEVNYFEHGIGIEIVGKSMYLS